MDENVCRKCGAILKPHTVIYDDVGNPSCGRCFRTKTFSKKSGMVIPVEDATYGQHGYDTEYWSQP